MCSYCDEHEAGYIPDGARGPMCGPCMDLAYFGDEGWEQVLQKLYTRRISPWRSISTSNCIVNLPGNVRLNVASYIVGE